MGLRQSISLQWRMGLPDGGGADLIFRDEVPYRRQVLAGPIKLDDFLGSG